MRKWKEPNHGDIQGRHCGMVLKWIQKDFCPMGRKIKGASGSPGLTWNMAVKPMYV